MSNKNDVQDLSLTTAKLNEVKEFLEIIGTRFNFTNEMIHQATQPTRNPSSIPSQINTNSNTPVSQIQETPSTEEENKTASITEEQISKKPKNTTNNNTITKTSPETENNNDHNSDDESTYSKYSDNTEENE